MADEAGEQSALPPVDTEAFSGPLDLLLHLIRVNQISITDIPIAKITEQYTAYLDAMGARPDVASVRRAGGGLITSSPGCSCPVRRERRGGSPPRPREAAGYERFKQMAERSTRSIRFGRDFWPRPRCSFDRRGQRKPRGPSST
jgi:segregation and condensation protein A